MKTSDMLFHLNNVIKNFAERKNNLNFKEILEDCYSKINSLNDYLGMYEQQCGIIIREIPWLENGLKELEEKCNRAYIISDGLEPNEYIFYDKEKGFCYEDNCVIGKTVDKAMQRLNDLEWTKKHKFFIVIKNSNGGTIDNFFNNIKKEDN